MALKDWKLVMNYTRMVIYYQHRDHRSYNIFIAWPTTITHSDNLGYCFRPKNAYNKYQVRIYFNSKNIDIRKFFKTKGAALKFAKSYMRKH